MAPPSKYRDHFCELARWMARYGLTAEEIATELGVSRFTLYKWRKVYPEFAEAMDDGRDLADARVEDSLHNRAVGIKWDEKTWEVRLNPESGKYELTLTKVVTKFIPPDTMACNSWLNNRRPDRWRSTHRTEHTGKDGGPIEHEHEHEFANLTDEELKAEIVREAESITGRASTP